MELLLESFGGWFTRNDGQIDDPLIHFEFTSGNIVMSFRESSYSITLEKNGMKPSCVEIVFLGSNPVRPAGKEDPDHRSNYFYGSDPSGWFRNVPNYYEIVYPNIYDDIDLVFSTNDDGFKYEFLVNPGGDPDDIRVEYSGIHGLSLDGNGALNIITDAGVLIDERPYTYQLSGQDEIEIESSYSLHEFVVSISVGSYDHSFPLVIDPMVYSTFIGRDDLNYGYDIVVDENDRAYIVGSTNSDIFPIEGSCYDPVYNGGTSDIIVVCIDPDGKSLFYSTYVGGRSYDSGYDITIDEDRNVYVTGYTGSNNFPTTDGCYQEEIGGMSDTFVFSLNESGSELRYSTYLGGDGSEVGEGIVLDEAHNTYITGHTTGEDFPTTPDCYDDSYNGGDWDGFISSFTSDGSGLRYSTLFGGNQTDYPYELDLDENNNAFVTGYTMSPNFPVTPGCFNDTYVNQSEIFVLCMDEDGSDLVYSTYVPGDGGEMGYHLLVEDNGKALVCGYTSSPDFPTTPGCYDDSFNGTVDAVIFSLEPDGSDLEYSTYFGGESSDYARGVARDKDGNIYVHCWTYSEDFPTTDGCFQSAVAGELDGGVVRFNQDCSELHYSTYIGGSGREYPGYGIALGSENNVYTTGYSLSKNFPITPGCYDNRNDVDPSGWNIIAFRFDLLTGVIDLISPRNVTQGDSIEFSGHGELNFGDISSYRWRSSMDDVFYEGPQSTIEYSGLSPGNHTIFFSVQDDDGDWSAEVNDTVRINGLPVPTIDKINPDPGVYSEFVRFEGSATDDGSVVSYRWESSIDGFLSNESDFHYTAMS